MPGRPTLSVLPSHGSCLWRLVVASGTIGDHARNKKEGWGNDKRVSAAGVRQIRPDATRFVPWSKLGSCDGAREDEREDETGRVRGPTGLAIR